MAAESNQTWLKLVLQMRCQVHDPHAERAAKPLVRRSDQRVHAGGGHIDRYGACGLRSVYDQQRPMLVRGLGQRGHVVALPGGVLNLRNADRGCVSVDQSDQIVEPDVAISGLGQPHLRASAPRHTFPRINGARERDINSNDIRFRAGSESPRERGQQLRRAGAHGDVIGLSTE